MAWPYQKKQKTKKKSGEFHKDSNGDCEINAGTNMNTNKNKLTQMDAK